MLSKKSECSEKQTKPHSEVLKQMGPKTVDLPKHANSWMQGHQETQTRFLDISEDAQLLFGRSEQPVVLQLLQTYEKRGAVKIITIWLLGGGHNPSSAHSSALGPFFRVPFFNAGSATLKDQTIACQWLPVYGTDLRSAVVHR